MIKKEFKLIILCLFLLLCSCIKSGDNPYHSLSDGFLDIYKIDIPYEDFHYDMRFHEIMFWFDEDYSLTDVAEKFMDNGYKVEMIEDKDKFLIYVNYKNNYVKAFYVRHSQYDEVSRFYIGEFSRYFGGAWFPYPMIEAERTVYHKYVLGEEEDIFDDCLFELKTNETVDNMIDFYNHSLTEIVKKTDDYFIIRAIDKKMGITYNSFIRIDYYTMDGYNYFKFTRIKNV